jgi:hypothetical protein
MFTRDAVEIDTDKGERGVSTPRLYYRGVDTPRSPGCATGGLTPPARPVVLPEG